MRSIISSFIALLLFLFIFILSGLGFSAETNLAKEARLISCGYYLGSQTPEQIIDGNSSTYWSCGILHNQWGEHWIIFDFGGLAEITRFSIKHAAIVNLPGTLNTQEFVIEAGSSIDGSWHQVAIFNNNTQENQNEYNFPHIVQTRYIRLYIIKPNYFSRDDNFARIVEVEFWGTKLKSHFNLIPSVQAATPNTNNVVPESIASNNKIKAQIPKNNTITQTKINSNGSPSANYSDYLLYGAIGLGILILLIVIVALLRWLIAHQKTNKQLKQKQEAEQVRLQKQQEAEKVKLEKQQAVAAKFQEAFDAGMKAMDDGRYEDAAQSFYQAQGLRPDSTEAKSKLVYCKNLMKAAKGNTE